jgi:hypothetical protein
MRSYWHLSEDERDQSGVLRAAGGRLGPLPGRSVGRKPPFQGSCSGTLSPRADSRPFTPPEPINGAGAEKRSSKDRLTFIATESLSLWTPCGTHS